MLDNWLQRAQSHIGAWLIFGIILLPVYAMLLGWVLGKPRNLRVTLMGLGYLILIPTLLWGGLAVFVAILGRIFFR